MTRVLFVIDGRSGSGKSSIQEYLQRVRPDIVVLPRFTTCAHSHKPAHGAFVDKTTITESDFDAMTTCSGFLWYSFGSHRYGFSVWDVLTESGPTLAFLIVRDINLIARLKILGLAASFQVVAIYLRATYENCRKHLGSSGYGWRTVQHRLERDLRLYPDGRESSSVYDTILDNSGDEIQLHESFAAIVRTYECDHPELRKRNPDSSKIIT